MANIARLTVEAKIYRLMASYVDNPHSNRTLKFITPLVILRNKEDDSISEIVGLTIPLVSNTPLVKVEFTKNHKSYCTLYSIGNFSDDTLELILSSAEEAMASDDSKGDMPGIYHIESWWRHNGCWDREQASGIPYCGEDNYLSITDAWWETLTDEEKEQVFNDFFEDL